MKKIFLILSFILLSVTKIFGQAAVDIPFTFYDGVSTDTNLHVGLDPTATYGIDYHLGEFIVPTHLPPTGLIWLWFYLDSLELATYKDYRNAASFPYSGFQIHKIGGFLSIGYTEFTIFFNFPQGVTANVKDPFGGTIFNQDLSDSGSYSFPSGYYDAIILTMYYDNIIPVELTSFTTSVLQNENAVKLKWETATETNNSGFEIQRTSRLPSPYQGKGVPTSRDGRGWEKIGFIPGFGTTTEPKLYSFIDDLSRLRENVTTGTYKYRLKQIDFDGTFTYSKEIEVVVDFTPKEFVLYQNYPNPFNPSTVIKYEIPGQTRNDNILVVLKVYDVLGNEVATLVNEEKPAGEYEVEFDATNFPSGIYFYQLRVYPAEGGAGSFVETKKMVLLK
ncbi:MAG: hypothetical protein DRQ13_08740 [Ignavibacteriae bacterium]|nr:MAG: hypothetical protein DRQ13_08740 [Ignavibacteriota bacterium]